MSTDETALTRLRETAFVVEATSFEVQALWSDHSIESGGGLRDWRIVNPGWFLEVGKSYEQPVSISTSWARIDGQLVMFWEAVSNFVDVLLIDAWIRLHFNGKWGNGTKDATTNAMNFHHCLQAIDEINFKSLEQTKAGAE